MGVSVALAGVVFAGVGGLVAAAVATAHVVAARRDVDVSFAELAPTPAPRVEPALPPPPPPRARLRGDRAAARRTPVGTPGGIPDEQPEEADGDLAEAGETGPVDGVLGEEGQGDGTGPRVAEAREAEPPARLSPTQVVESIERPRFLSGCIAPEIGDALGGQAATLRVEVRMLVGIDGRVTDATLVEASALVPAEAVLACARAQVFEPARLPDGTRVPYPFRRRFVFRPASA